MARARHNGEGEGVGAFPALKHVAAALAVEHVGARIADQIIVGAVAGEIDGSRSAPR